MSHGFREWRNNDANLGRFDTIPDCEGRTDRQTDKHLCYEIYQRLHNLTCHATRWKNRHRITGNAHICIQVSRNTLDCDQSNYSSRVVFSHTPIAFVQTGISADPPRRYRHFNFPRWRLGRHLGFGETGNSAIWSADLENHNVEPNMKWIGRPLAEIWPFEISTLWAKWEVGRSPVGPQYFLHCSHILLFATLGT